MNSGRIEIRYHQRRRPWARFERLCRWSVRIIVAAGVLVFLAALVLEFKAVVGALTILLFLAMVSLVSLARG